MRAKINTINEQRDIENWASWPREELVAFVASRLQERGPFPEMLGHARRTLQAMKEGEDLTGFFVSMATGNED